MGVGFRCSKYPGADGRRIPASGALGDGCPEIESVLPGMRIGPSLRIRQSLGGKSISPTIEKEPPIAFLTRPK